MSGRTTETLGALVLGQQAPDIISSAWGAIFQAGAVGVLLGAALWLIVVRGLLRPEREFKAQEAQAAKTDTEQKALLAKVEADCDKDRNDLRADFDRRSAEAQARYAEMVASYEQRIAEKVASYEQRIAKYDTIVAKQEAMIYDLTGATRTLAHANSRKEGA